ncbi:PTS sugar transporter [Clostridium diolis]|uniref:PTS mannose/fructose/sorbose/N-acetylgalactosamine transporter subunit IIC n=1 Tax=Clostridium diolis TaxID=223919 RepID=UPI000B402DA4|nr:PTS sugar transporter subunit IIC [Clostridium diolis]OVE67904.1 PTS sugar transporter [Clostridium diolis]
MTQAILVGLIAMFVTFEWCLGSCLITRPIVTGVLVGLVMGDLQTGIIMGATLEMAFIGAVTLGAAVPPDVITGGILGTAFAIATGQGAEVALTLAFPIATLFLLVDNVMTLFVMPFFLHKADKYVEEGNFNGVSRMHFLGGFVVKSLPRGIFVALALYLGSPFMSAVLESIPQFVQNGLVVAAGFIPALGISLLAQMILTKKLVIFFVLGFAISAYLKIPMLGIAIFATIIAIVLVGLQNNNVKKQEVMLDEDF